MRGDCTEVYSCGLVDHEQQSQRTIPTEGRELL